MTTLDSADLRNRAPVADDAQAIEVAHELAAQFAVNALERDRRRLLPRKEVDQLSESGLLAITVPARFGGADLAPSTVSEVVRIIAAADPNIAQIPHSHYVYLNLIRLAGTAGQQETMFGRVLAGARIANAQSERGGTTVADIATTLTRSGNEFSVNGEKFYCTGSLFADSLAVLTRYAGDEIRAAGEYIAFVPADAPGITIVDDWNGMGQRTTGSGTVRFDGVSVAPDQIIERARAVNTPRGYGSFAQLLHVAIDAGIARGALDTAAEFVRTRSRPWYEAGVQRAVDDPLLVQRFGELSVEVSTAETTLTAAGHAVDRIIGGDAAADASIAVATAKIVADRVANSVTSALFEVSGTRSAADDLNLSAFWRNARTHTLHDPVRWKYQHVGAYVLRGQPPPQHGVI